MNTEFFEALTLLEKEKGISADYLLEKIQNAIVIACLLYTSRPCRQFPGCAGWT